MKNRIIISVTSDLSTDQRVLKVAKSCYSNGYDVLLIGRKVKSSQPLSLPFQFIRMRLLFHHSVFFYIEFNIRLFILLLFKRSTVFLSNDTDTLIANFLASKICRKKLVFDAHELFPEVPELVNRPKVKYLWQNFEDTIFPHLAHSYTVCDSIAKHYNQKYNIDMQIIRNVPYFRSYTSSIKKINYPNKKIILYQGALNVGRGLEWVLDAMPFIENAILIIIGDGDIRENLQNQTQRLQIENKVLFLGKIEAEQLHEYTSSADIGLCLLERIGLSYYYALPNRIFDYLQANVPVLASSFPEISKIVDTYKTGILIDHYEPLYLAETINNMLRSPFNTDNFGSAAKELCWENEEKLLMEIIKKAIL